MHTLRCFVAVVFVLVWYFSAFGQLWTQAFFFFLSFFSFFFKNQERETSTQTDDLTEETTRKVTLAVMLSSLFEKYCYGTGHTHCVVYERSYKGDMKRRILNV